MNDGQPRLADRSLIGSASGNRQKIIRSVPVSDPPTDA